ncbi:MAG TPA: metalloprotease TldD [Candidatus Binatia bacterium]|nr:metalloprotease TldD [Candidatus Binatia bacterium]
MRPTALSPEQLLLDQHDLTARQLEQVLGTALARRADYADLYFEARSAEAVSLEEGLVKKTARSISQGVGVRVLAGDKTGYAHSDDITLDTLQIAARTARAVAHEPGEAQVVSLSGPSRAPRDLYALRTPPTTIPLSEKIALLQQVDEEARRYDPRITNVMASLTVEQKHVLILTSAGAMVADTQPLLRLQVTCIAAQGATRQQGSYGGGGRVEFNFLFDNDRWRTFTREAARQAILGLDAVPAPAGTLTVVLGPGWPGILLHEAIGHGLEGDFNRKKVSAFSDLMGKKVAAELCTVVDDGTLPNRRGSLNVDDEGTPTGRTVLIEKGVLRGYLQDRLNATLMKMPLTGNGRRESFAHMPMPRMTNTFMLPGDATPEDIIKSVPRGLYAVSFGGGQVDITSGKFVFSASEAYLIEGGKVTRPVKGATLIGNGPEVLTRITMVGNDLKLDDGIGTCGKDGQSVPVGVGLPTVRIDGLTVGGTQA